jgi:hypothetical protein
MPSPSSIFNFKRQNPLAGLLLFALAVVLIESTLALLPQNSLITSFRAQNVPATAPDWQIMGDSVAAGGIRADQLATHLAPATNVVNLALSGSGPEFPYFILKRQIATGVTPKAILYAPSPHTFGSERIALLVGAYATWPEIAEIASSGIEPFEVLYGVMCKLSYSLRHREQLAEVLKGRSEPTRTEPAAVTENEVKAVAKEKSFPADKIHPMYKKPFTVANFNRHFFEKFMVEAQARQIPIHWVSMPTLEVVKDARKPYQFEEDYQAFLKANRQRYGFHLLMPQSPIFQPQNFEDYTHLNSNGAEKVTHMLALEIEKGNR